MSFLMLISRARRILLIKRHFTSYYSEKTSEKISDTVICEI